MGIGYRFAYRGCPKDWIVPVEDSLNVKDRLRPLLSCLSGIVARIFSKRPFLSKS
jgi:hypothetical protein